MKESLARILFSVAVISTMIFAQSKSELPRVIRYNGTLHNVDGSPRSGVAGITFAIYADQQSAAPLWQEVQTVTVDSDGHYTVLLGGAKSEGLPPELFATNDARWLGIRIDNEQEQPRTILAAVPYAIKAGDAETLGGKPLSAFVLHEAANNGTSGSNGSRKDAGAGAATNQSGIAFSAPLTSANQVAKFTDNTGTLGNSTVFDNGTNVGIGTTNPLGTLHVYGANAPSSGGSSITGDLILQGTGGTFGGAMGSYDNGAQQYMWFQGRYTDSAVYRPIVLNPSGGNIGIGTSNPLGTLHLQGPNAIEQGQAAVNGALIIQGAGTFAGAMGTYDNGVPGGQYMWIQPRYMDNAVYRNLVLNPTAGNVGIGTTAPAAKLDVVGGINASGSVSAGTNLCIAADCRTSWPTGTVTSVAAGTGLTATPSPITSTGTLSFDTTFGDARYSQLGATNTFTSGQTVSTSDLTAISATGAAVGLNATGASYGVYATGTAANSTGVYGLAAGTNGSTSYGVFGQSNSIAGQAVRAYATATTGATYGIFALDASTSGVGTNGWATATTGSTVGAYGRSDSTSGYGVLGITPATSGTTYGVWGHSYSSSGYGVLGWASSLSGANQGGYFQSDSTGGNATVGHATATTGSTTGGWFQSDSTSGVGLRGSSIATSGATVGVQGYSASPGGYAAMFQNTDAGGKSFATLNNLGNEVVTILSNGQVGIGTTSPGANSKLNIVGGGIAIGSSAQTTDAALHITSAFGCCGRLTQMSVTGSLLPALNLMASTDNQSNQQFWAWGVDTDNKFKIQSGIGFGTGGLTVDSSGNTHVGGTLTVVGSITAGVKDFKIDHPLDPENKYLVHASIESSEMMNIYTGNVALDKKGKAWVELPDWFEALNTDFRYQLTCIGGFAPVYVANEIEGHRFRIAGGKPGMKISWQVSGVRKDAYALEHRMNVEEMKPEAERGTYLYPTSFGQSAGKTQPSGKSR